MTTHFETYFMISIRVFFLSFIIGKSIDNLFVIIQQRYPETNKLIFGMLQLIVVIISAYYLHIFTSNTFSTELQIYSPHVLFSSFTFALQSNMMKNFELITYH